MKMLTGSTFLRHVYIVHFVSVIAATTWSLTEKVRANKKNKSAKIYKLMPQGLSFCFCRITTSVQSNGQLCTK